LRGKRIAENATKQLRQIKTVFAIFIAPAKNRLRIFPRGLYNFVMMPVCP
jgi:hypothetical protein